MASVKTLKEIEIMREGGRRLAFVLEEVIKKVHSGVTPLALDAFAEELISEGGDIPAFKGYIVPGAAPYPATLCVSPNDTVVHGIPTGEPLKEGDAVVLDIGLTHKGFVVDMAKTVSVGAIDAEAKKLLRITEEALYKGIESVRDGARVGDIGEAVSRHVHDNGCEIIRALGGHGIGKKLHEDPYIPNFGRRGEGAELVEGMTIAIEPIVTEGKDGIRVLSDGWTLVTRDGKRSAQFEHTILVTKKGAEILTK